MNKNEICKIITEFYQKSVKKRKLFLTLSLIRLKIYETNLEKNFNLNDRQVQERFCVFKHFSGLILDVICTVSNPI